MSTVLGLYNYWIVIFLMMTGFYIVISRGNLVKKVIGLNIFQTSVFLLYITSGVVEGGTALRIGEDLVRFCDLAETGFGLRVIRIGVGMGIPCQLAESSLDVVLSRISCHSENLVVVLHTPRLSSSPSPTSSTTRIARR
jgi:hypothetical protein